MTSRARWHPVVAGVGCPATAPAEGKLPTTIAAVDQTLRGRGGNHLLVLIRKTIVGD